MDKLTALVVPLLSQLESCWAVTYPTEEWGLPALLLADEESGRGKSKIINKPHIILWE